MVTGVINKRQWYIFLGTKWNSFMFPEKDSRKESDKWMHQVISSEQNNTVTQYIHYSSQQGLLLSTFI
jgi:hypothetical protein